MYRAPSIIWSSAMLSPLLFVGHLLQYPPEECHHVLHAGQIQILSYIRPCLTLKTMTLAHTHVFLTINASQTTYTVLVLIFKIAGYFWNKLAAYPCIFNRFSIEVILYF